MVSWAKCHSVLENFEVIEDILQPGKLDYPDSFQRLAQIATGLHTTMNKETMG